MKKIIFCAIALMGILSTSCDDYLDINYDPNSPSEEAVNNNYEVLFPAIEMNLAGTYGDFFRITGGYFAQYYSQTFGTSNYLDYSQFTMSATRSSGAYTQLNSRALKNLQTVLENSKANEKWGTYLAATTLRAFIYQALVDCYGELPYSEAFQGLENPTPKYDQGQDIYNGIIAELDFALEKADPNQSVATNFLFPFDDELNAEKWISFANALKLKILMRESAVANVQSQLDALVAENNFPSEDVCYKNKSKNGVNKVVWLDEPGHFNPFYAEEISSKWGSSQVNVIANIALIGTMQQMNEDGDIIYSDPRLPKIFKAGSNGYYGGVSGTNFSTSDNYKSAFWCRPNVEYDEPVVLISVSEVDFFLAEYYAKKGNEAMAKQYYEAAIEASCQMYGVSGSDVIAQFPYDQANYKKCIGISKWLALAGFNTYEGWCEARRLGYPEFGTISGTDIYNEGADRYAPDKYVPGTFYTPIKVNGNLGNNKLLQRWPYAESSSSRNQNAPKQDETVYGTPVFWAVK